MNLEGQSDQEIAKRLKIGVDTVRRILDTPIERSHRTR